MCLQSVCEIVKDGIKGDLALVAWEVGDLVGNSVPNAMIFFGGSLWRGCGTFAGIVSWIEI